jgi:hypothetical protein
VSWNRYNKRPDSSQADIVKDLREKGGWRVDIIGRPVDLLCFKVVSLEQLMRATACEGGFRLFMPLEAKTARGKKNPKAVVDKRQQEQIDFINDTGTRRVTSGFEARLALGDEVSL